MAADYAVAVWVRYALLLAAGGIARLWVLPDAWSIPIAVGVLAYALAVIHTEPAARYARGIAEPWRGRMMLSAACAHAFGAAAVYALGPLVEPQYEQPAWGGMQFEKLWVVEPPSLLEVGLWIGVYALVAGGWAVMVGWMARGMWGTVAPDGHLVRIRGPAGTARG